ncbi:MAG: hypothetical protein EBU90_31695 [Proteobacteria bacterium]|nr:hypothetical protein [Pseudomonadota bacterium]
MPSAIEDFYSGNLPSYYDFSSTTTGFIFEQNKRLITDTIGGITPKSDNFLADLGVRTAVTNLLVKPVLNNPTVIAINYAASIAESISITNAAVDLGLVSEFNGTDFARNLVSVASINPVVQAFNTIAESLTGQHIATPEYRFSYEEIRNIVTANDPSVTGLSYKEMGALNIAAKQEALQIYENTLLGAGTGRSEDYIEEGFATMGLQDPFLERYSPFDNPFTPISFSGGGGGRFN